MIEEPAGAGPAAARNAGASRAQGDVLVFVDSDVVVRPDALGRVRAAFADPGLTALFGAYEARAEGGTVSSFRNLLHHHVHAESAGPAQTFWAGLGAVRRDAFLEAGGFDAERYPRPSVEDIEFGLRLAGGGARIDLDPEVAGRHLKRWTLASMLRTDVCDRGAPWVALILREDGAPPVLNLGWRHRLAPQPASWPSARCSAAAAARRWRRWRRWSASTAASTRCWRGRVAPAGPRGCRASRRPPPCLDRGGACRDPALRENWLAGQSTRLAPMAALREGQRACVIGAGSSGITACQVLDARGIPFDCFEKGSEVGGNWRYENDNGMSSAYRSLHINTSRRMMSYAAFPMPEDYPDYPSHWQIAHYFDDYVDHFGLRERIRFRTEVLSVEPGRRRVGGDGRGRPRPPRDATATAP